MLMNREMAEKSVQYPYLEYYAAMKMSELDPLWPQGDIYEKFLSNRTSFRVIYIS